MKMTLENIVYSRTIWNRVRNGGVWGVPMICGVMIRTPKGFSLFSLMPYTPEVAQAAADGGDVPKSPEEMLAFQRQNFDMIKEHFEAAGLTFDDPQNLLGRNEN